MIYNVLGKFLVIYKSYINPKHRSLETLLYHYDANDWRGIGS